MLLMITEEQQAFVPHVQCLTPDGLPHLTRWIRLHHPHSLWMQKQREVR